MVDGVVVLVDARKAAAANALRAAETLAAKLPP